MEFTPRSEQEIRNARIWKKGTYDFEITEASERLSKTSQKPMIELKVMLTNAEGGKRYMNDYLMPQMAGKFRHAAEACGLLERYESGKILDSDFKGKKGKLLLVVEKDKTKKYPDKNAILDYVTPVYAPVETEGLERFTRV